MTGANMSENHDFKYWAFISYSSKDSRWGSWLHRRLEQFPIPGDFQGLKLFDGAVLGKHLRPIFRDRDELAGSAELGPAIAEALAQSRYLVVLCSKNAAKSRWVNKEIEDFQALGRGGLILALILDGEPNSTSKSNFDDAEECFPPALRYPAEPLAGDLRPDGDGQERGLLKIVAGLTQLDFDKLYRRHERALRRRRLVLGGVAAGLIAVLAGLSLFAFQQKFTADARAEQIEEQRDVIAQRAQELATEKKVSEERAKQVEEERDHRTQQLARDFYRRAMQLNAENQHAQARLLLLEALKLDPSFGAALDQFVFSLRAWPPRFLVKWEPPYVDNLTKVMRESKARGEIMEVMIERPDGMDCYAKKLLGGGGIEQTHYLVKESDVRTSKKTLPRDISMLATVDLETPLTRSKDHSFIPEWTDTYYASWPIPVLGWEEKRFNSLPDSQQLLSDQVKIPIDLSGVATVSPNKNFVATIGCDDWVTNDKFVLRVLSLPGVILKNELETEYHSPDLIQGMGWNNRSSEIMIAFFEAKLRLQIVQIYSLSKSEYGEYVYLKLKSSYSYRNLVIPFQFFINSPFAWSGKQWLKTYKMAEGLMIDQHQKIQIPRTHGLVLESKETKKWKGGVFAKRPRLLKLGGVLSLDQERLAVQMRDGTIELREARSGKRLATIQHLVHFEDWKPITMAWSPKDRYFVISELVQDGQDVMDYTVMYETQTGLQAFAKETKGGQAEARHRVDGLMGAFLPHHNESLIKTSVTEIKLSQQLSGAQIQQIIRIYTSLIPWELSPTGAFSYREDFEFLSKPELEKKLGELKALLEEAYSPVGELKPVTEFTPL